MIKTLLKNIWNNVTKNGIRIQEFTSDSVTCGAGGTGYVNIPFTVPSGYSYATYLNTKAIGNTIESYASGTSGQAITVWWHNNWTTSLTAQFAVRVLFIKVGGVILNLFHALPRLGVMA